MQKRMKFFPIIKHLKHCHYFESIKRLKAKLSFSLCKVEFIGEKTIEFLYLTVQEEIFKKGPKCSCIQKYIVGEHPEFMR